MNTIAILETIVRDNKNRKDIYKQDLLEVKQKLEHEKKIQKDIDIVKNIFQNIAKHTQNQIKTRLSDIVTLALQTVFADSYKLDIEFVCRRNKTEADISIIEKNGDRFNPMEDEGGGVLDIVSFALRIALQSLLNNNRNVLIFDEPFRFVSKNHLDKVTQLIKHISEELKIQFIVVTHIKQLTQFADKTFNIHNGEIMQ